MASKHISEADARIYNALLKLIDAILDAVEVAGEVGAPSGVIYAALSQFGVDLGHYEQIIDAMVASEKLAKSGHTLKLGARSNRRYA
jgi:hypothetical protein